MSIDMELMRRKLASLRGENKGDSNSVWFKPDEGDTDHSDHSNKRWRSVEGNVLPL